MKDKETNTHPPQGHFTPIGLVGKFFLWSSEVPEDLANLSKQMITLHCMTGSTRVGVRQEASVKIEN